MYTYCCRCTTVYFVWYDFIWEFKIFGIWGRRLKPQIWMFETVNYKVNLFKYCFTIKSVSQPFSNGHSKNVVTIINLTGYVKNLF